MQLLPAVNLSPSELMQAAAILDQPIIKKYFLMLALPEMAAILSTSPSPGESPESYLRRLEKARGVVSVLETLIKIEAAPAEQQ